MVLPEGSSHCKVIQLYGLTRPLCCRVHDRSLMSGLWGLDYPCTTRRCDSICHRAEMQPTASRPSGAYAETCIRLLTVIGWDGHCLKRNIATRHPLVTAGALVRAIPSLHVSLCDE